MAKFFVMVTLFVYVAISHSKKIEKRDAPLLVDPHGYPDYTPIYPVQKYQKKYVGLEHKLPALYAPRDLHFGPHGPYGYGYPQYGGRAYKSVAYGKSYTGYAVSYGGNHHDGHYSRNYDGNYYEGNHGGNYGGHYSGSYGGNHNGNYGAQHGGHYDGHHGGHYGGSHGENHGHIYG